MRLLSSELGLKATVGGSIFTAVILTSLATGKLHLSIKAAIAILGTVTTSAGAASCYVLKSNRPWRLARREVNKELAIQGELTRLPRPICSHGETHETQQQPAVMPAQTEINWGEVLAAPHLAVVGKTGSGKSALTQWLASNLGGDIAVYDSDASPSEWQGLKVIGRGANYEQIAQAMQSDLDELQRRTEARANGQHDFLPMVRILEESPETLSALKDAGLEIGYQWLKGILRRGRKYGVKLILLSQGFSVRSLRIEGEGELRDNIAVLRLGKVAIAHGKKHLDEYQLQILKQQSRPVLLEDEQTGCVPDLSAFLANQKGGDRPINLTKPEDVATSPPTEIKWLEYCHGLECSSVAKPEAATDEPESCPHCGSYKIKWLSKKAGRKQCKNCSKTWSI